MSRHEPWASVVICTRNRGASVVATVASVLQNTYPAFDVWVVDQSTSADTGQALQALAGDPRLHYVASATQGAGRARNIALAAAQGELILITDDDCTVPAGWIEAIVAIFCQHPRVGLIFSNVTPGEHDATLGVIPNHCYTHSRTVRSLAIYAQSIGMGAGMSIRRQTLSAIGLLDEHLGPGSTLFSGEDHDMAIRAIIHEWWVYEAAEVSVLHHGFRTFQMFSQLTRRDWVALGAVHAKFLKCGQWQVWPLIIYNTLVRGLWQPLAMLLELKRPTGFRRFVHYWEGFYRGWRTPVDRQRLVYC